MTSPRIAWLAFLAALWAPLVAVLCSKQLPTFVAAVVRDPSSFESERNRLRMATPLWNDAVAFYNDTVYALGASGRPGAAFVGRKGWIFLGDIFESNIAQALGRRVLDDREVADRVATLRGETEWLARRNIPSLIVVAPAKWSIYPDRLPRWAHGGARVHPFDRVLGAAAALPIIDLRGALRSARDRADTYSALNSHWTDYGGYVAWERIVDALSQNGSTLPPLARHAATSIFVTDDGNEFAGMMSLAAHNAWTRVVVDPPLAPSVAIAADGRETPLAAGAATDVLDLPRTTRNELASNRLRVLIVRDSSGNSLSPFLQDAFYMTYQVDARWGRGYGPSVPALVDALRPDLVISILAERHFDGLLGNAEYWRAANAFDCATDFVLSASGQAAVVSRNTDGSEEVLSPRDDRERPAVYALSIESEGDGELSLINGVGKAAEAGRLYVVKGKNKLFFNVEAVKPTTRFVVKHSGAKANVVAVEARAGGCLAAEDVRAAAAGTK